MMIAALARLALWGGLWWAAAASAEGQTLSVLSRMLPVYAAPGLSAPVIGQIRRGEEHSVLAVEGDWVALRLPAGRGWVQRFTLADGQASLTLQAARGASRRALDETGVEPPPVEVVRPGGATAVVSLPPIDPAQVAPPAPHLPREFLPVPDRWRLMQALGFRFPWWDPYNPNVLKGDLPLTDSLGPEWFVNLGLVSDTVFEWRALPTPVAAAGALSSAAQDAFAAPRQAVFAQTLIVSASLIKGDTTFRPPDFEARLVPVFQVNRARVSEGGVVKVSPAEGAVRRDSFATVQEAFLDVHLRNVSPRYDFDSLRVGVQPITSDFRGFLFQDVAPGLRLFGNRANNQYQYNLAYFRRAEKDTNSGLNDFSVPLRADEVWLANVYRQDWPRPGFTVQGTLLHNRNREDTPFYDANGFLVRPALIGDVRGHRYAVSYLGLNGDGHLGRWNLSTSTYLAQGNDERHPLSGRAQAIRAGFHASELSRDFDWLRLRAQVLWASGDRDPYDGRATGFDAIFENPQFAGADTSFFMRQAVPLIGGGGVALSGRNGLLPSLRSSKDQGQSNFVNPGLTLFGLGADVDVAPAWRVLGNVSRLAFVDTAVLSALRGQALPARALGTDVSIGFQFRPFYSQNVIVNGSAAMLLPGPAWRALYPDSRAYSALLNFVLSF